MFPLLPSNTVSLLGIFSNPVFSYRSKKHASFPRVDSSYGTGKIDHCGSIAWSCCPCYIATHSRWEGTLEGHVINKKNMHTTVQNQEGKTHRLQHHFSCCLMSSDCPPGDLVESYSCLVNTGIAYLPRSWTGGEERKGINMHVSREDLGRNTWLIAYV